MMSPPTTSSDLPNHRRANNSNEFRSSNTTASLFLGGVRRSWMPSPSLSTTPGESPSLPIPVSAPTVGHSRRRSKGMRNPHSRVPSVSSSWTQSQKENNEKDVAPTVTAAVPARPALMSPVTPGEAPKEPLEETSSLRTLPLPSPSHSNNLPTERAISGRPIVVDLSESQSSSLPSPDPSRTSHTSPLSVIDQYGETPSNTVLPSPSPIGQMQTQLQPQNSPQARSAMSALLTTTSGSAPVAVTTFTPTTRSPLQQQVYTNPQQAMAHPQPLPPPPPPPSLPRQRDSPSIRLPEGQEIHSPNAAVQVQPVSYVNPEFWSQLQKHIDNLMAASQQSMSLSETVELPRVRLLRDACNVQDLLYLALHQVYCLQTFSPSEFSRLPYFGPKQSTGLDVIKQLLVANHQLSGDFLKWCVHFPKSIWIMIQTPEYITALYHLSHCLGLLSEGWVTFDKEVRARAYPPLIDELVRQFGITSSVLISIIFLAMCRRLYGIRNEERLRGIFLKNKENYDRRFTTGVTADQICRENEQLIQAYRSLGTPPASRASSSSRAGERFPSQQLPPSQPMQSALISAPGSRGQNMHAAARQHMARNPQIPNQFMLTSQNAPLSSTPIPMNAQESTQHRSSPWLASLGFSRSSRIAPSQTINMNPNSPSILASELVQGPHHRPPQDPQHPQHPQQGIVSNGAQPSPRHVHTRLPTQGSQPHPPIVQPQLQQQGCPPLHTPLLPPAGWISTNTRLNPLRVGLHQAHLRDPATKLVLNGPAGEKEPGLFQYLGSFIIPPTLLGQTEYAFSWKFSLTGADCARFPQIQPPGIDQRPVRVLGEGNQIYRLRCIRVPPSTNEVSQNAWSVSESIWPSVIYIFVNNVELYVRRKVHNNGKDLPLDITGFLREGVNIISLHFIRSDAECEDLVYALGVEVMDISGFDRVKKLVQGVPASESRERIRKRLLAGTTDDELTIVSDYLTINLMDPFMARTFNVPARSTFCGHQECFDLETFIMTKASKPGKSSVKDIWKCPICGADARPQNLVIDGFLAEIHANLERTNRLGVAKAIKFKTDGSWELVTEEETSVTNEHRSSSNPLKRKMSGTVAGHSPLQRLKTEWSSRDLRPSHDSLASPVIELD